MACGRNLILYKRRRVTFPVTLNDVNGSPLIITGGDNIRLKIGKEGHVPALDVDFRNPSANGSSLTLANPTTVTLAADDIGDNFRPGVYTVEFLHIDDAGNDEPTLADVQFAVVHETQLGSVSIDEESSSSTLSSSSSSSVSSSSSSS